MCPQVEVSALPVSCRPYDRWRIGITCVRLIVQPLVYRHYLCQVGRTTAGDLALPVPGRPYDRWRIDTTCARSTVRPLGIWPYLCQVDRMTAGALIPASDQFSTLGRSRRRTSCPKE
ncbi:hypothetical protein B296_00022603 [Ensete ventricosum]|uniref:Uncharacterized protein n=1 Tax=Ensete ventricosum TaxID=4639 RepID=A0A426YSY6_ENSVE|nr:hypothetical protein B296_00022603 [Ensete ventricosum]